MQRWNPRVDTTKQEKLILKRLVRVRALFSFFRLHRHELFDETFQEKLEAMYRQTGAGDPPHPPAMLCMVVLLQGYVGASDAEAVELALMDLRWQMVLDCLGADEPPFSQGALQAFRERMVAHDLDQLLLERSAEMVRQGIASQGDGQMLGKAVRVAFDSRPLTGAGRVEDTINLLGHAARSIVKLVSKLTQIEPVTLCRQAGIPVLLAPSIKAGLDLDWSDPKQKATGIEIVERQVSSLQRWVDRNLDRFDSEPLRPYIEALTVVKRQDLETKDGRVAIREGVAPDRRISIEEAESRHGRKSRSKRFDGYKEHIGRDLDVPAIVTCAITPANRPEEEAFEPMVEDLRRQGLRLAEAHFDRAYLNSPVVPVLQRQKCVIVCKAWGQRARHPHLYSKADFRLDLRARTITCPAGEVESFEPGETVHFDPEVCGSCPQRGSCTEAASGRGRSISIAADEALQKKLRARQSTRDGREVLRERVAVEHALAHIAARKGDTARYLGTRRNLFDLRRAAALQNFEALQRGEKEAAQAA